MPINKPTSDFVATTFDVALAQGESGAITAKIGTGLTIPATKSFLQVDYNSTEAVGAANGPETIYYAAYNSGTGALTGVVRGQAGTTDVAHDAGAEVQCAPSTAFFDDNTGWKEIKGTFAYASATTITVDTGATAIYSVGDKLRFQNNNSGTYLYAYVVAVAAALLTVAGDTVPNATLTDYYFSKATSPVGFPVLNWTPTKANITKGSGTETGKFWTNGRVCSFIWKLVLAADSSIGDPPTITLPIPADTTYNFDGSTIGEGTGLNAATELYTITLGWKTGVTYVLKAQGTGGTYGTNPGATATIPFAWGDADTIWIKGSYLY